MPRLPSSPVWSDVRRETRAFNLKTAYDAKAMSFNKYRDELKKLITTEKNAVTKRQEKADAREIAKEKERRDKEYKKEQKNHIFKEVKKNFKRKGSSNGSSINLQYLDDNVGLKDFIKFLIKLDKKIELRIGNKFYVISDFTRDKLYQIINETITVTELHEESWGAWVEQYEILQGDIIVRLFDEVKSNLHEASAFFKYTHNTTFDLKRYGVYQTGEEQNHDDTCLIVALRNGGLEAEKIETVKQYVKNRFIPQCDIKKICEKLKIKIILKKQDDKNPKIVYGKEYDREFLIGVLDNHYFLVEKTEITSYCLNHYNDYIKFDDENKNDYLHNLPDCNKIIKFNKKGCPVRDPSRYIDSFDVIKCLLNNKDKLLNLMSVDDRIIASTQFYKNVAQQVLHLEYDPNICIQPIEPKVCNEKITYNNLVFDFETYTLADGQHIPYLVRTYSDTRNDVFYGSDCALQMLHSIKSNTRLIAHNANYDYRFLIEHLYQINELSRGNNLISLKAKFATYEIEVKDSYHLISMPLRNFPKTFGLDCIKEVMPYQLYNDTQCEQRYMNINYVMETYIDDDDREQFLNNIKRWNLQSGEDYDIIGYSSKYCELDCIILWKGYTLFRKMMLECVKIDINDKLTIASLAHTYLVNQGCYDGVNQLGGSPQLFIQGCVVGGRTMTAHNKKIKLDEIVNDFDAVSLYPSAMSRLQGFLKGVPKVIKNTSYNWLKQQDGYFVDIVIKSVGIKRAFPLMSVKNENNVRMFNNDMIGQTIRVDKTTLEDLIEFQNITFDVVRGYYFDEGFNDKIVTTIKYLFNERLEQKKKKNPSEMIYKLIMNSSYGKSIMKPVDTESRFFDNAKDAQIYMTRHYNWLTHYVRFGSGDNHKTKVSSVKVLADHYNIAQVGVCILSMSKRIMNEVMCLAEDKELELYYQDTDSIHIKDKDIATLSNAFQDKYNRQLIGKNMGQFHSDFDLPGCKDIIARRSIFLGKKSYIDELQGINDKGQYVIDYHIRLKGIPNSTILDTCDRLGYSNPFELYADMYKGKPIEFDLTNNGTKANFKMTNDYKVKTLSMFKRQLKF